MENDKKTDVFSEQDLHIQSELATLLPAKQVSIETEVLKTYGRDWSTNYHSSPLAVIFPKTTDEVQTVIFFANQNQLKIVPSGGRTGLSGGAVASHHEIVLSFDKMNHILDFNPIDKTITVGAGLITAELQQYLRDKGFYYPVDFASSGSSQIGGNIATNAGGINVIRHGMTRDWVRGLRVVTGKGDILNLDKNLIKNNAGYDLKELFIGSEGTLGCITEVTMQYKYPPKNLTVLLLSLPTLESAMPILHEFESKLQLNAFEFFCDNALTKVLEKGNHVSPIQIRGSYYALIEFEHEKEEDLDIAMSLFETCLNNNWVVDGVMNQNETQKVEMWRLREDITEAISDSHPYKNDISVSVSKVPGFLSEVHGLLTAAYPEFEIIWFGHIGDGNMHLAILKPQLLSQEAFIKQCEDVTHQLFDIVKRYNGSISAEHGVGLLKQPYMHYQHSEQALTYMQAIKAVFDPNNTMNPGKLLDMETESS